MAKGVLTFLILLFALYFCLWRHKELFHNINSNLHSLNFYYVINLSDALTYLNLVYGKTSKMVNKTIKIKKYFLKLPYEKLLFYTLFYKSEHSKEWYGGSHIHKTPQLEGNAKKGLHVSFFWVRRLFLTRSKNSNHNFCIIFDLPTSQTYSVARKSSLNGIGHCIYAWKYYFKYCWLRKSSH